MPAAVKLKKQLKKCSNLRCGVITEAETDNLAGRSKKSDKKVKKRNEKKLQALAAQEVVNEANKLVNPLGDFPAFQIYERNNLKVHIKFFNVEDIGNETLQDIFNLEKNNMEILYKACSWGWEEEKKYKEMTEKSAKYLVAMNESNKVVGFSHFRFDMDYGNEVLYCYEIQLEPQSRGKGLGKFLIQILELIAFKNNMRKVILTVLKHNTGSVKFFHTLGYTIDETNPSEGIFDDVPYQILSKINRRLPPH